MQGSLREAVAEMGCVLVVHRSTHFSARQGHLQDMGTHAEKWQRWSQTTLYSRVCLAYFWR